MSWVYRPPDGWGRRVRRMVGPPVLLVATGLTAGLSQVDVVTLTAAATLNASAVTAGLSQVDVVTFAPIVTGPTVNPPRAPLLNQISARWAIYNPDWAPQIAASTIRFLPLSESGTLDVSASLSTVNVTTLTATPVVSGTGAITVPLASVNVATLSATGGGSGALVRAAGLSAVNVATVAPVFAAQGVVGRLAGLSDVNVTTLAAVLGYASGVPQQIGAAASVVDVVTLAPASIGGVTAVPLDPGLSQVTVETFAAGMLVEGATPPLVAPLAAVTVTTLPPVLLGAQTLLPLRVEFTVSSLYRVRWLMPRDMIKGKNDLLFKVRLFNELTGAEVTSGLPLTALVSATKGGAAIGSLSVALTYDGGAGVWFGVIDRATVEADLAAQLDGATLSARVDDGLNMRESLAVTWVPEPEIS